MVVKLAQGFNGCHLFPLQPETVAFLDDHNDVHEIQAVDANFFPGCVRIDELFFYFKLFYQKTVDFPYKLSFVHELNIVSKTEDKISHFLFKMIKKKREVISKETGIRREWAVDG